MTKEVSLSWLQQMVHNKRITVLFVLDIRKYTICSYFYGKGVILWDIWKNNGQMLEKHFKSKFYTALKFEQLQI